MPPFFDGGISFTAGLLCRSTDTAGIRIVAGREEVINRERYAAKQCAGVILAADAFLVGDAVIVSRDEKLSVSLKPDYGELAQGDIQLLAGAACNKLIFEAIRYVIRNRAADAVVIVAVFLINYLHRQCERVNCLNNADRKASLAVPAAAVFGRKDLGASFAAEENGSLLENCKSCNNILAGESNARHLVEIGYVAGIAALVKAQGFHSYICAKQPCAAGSDAECRINDWLGTVCWDYQKILNTIFIFAAVVNLARVYANRLADTARICRRNGCSIFRHYYTSW